MNYYYSINKIVPGGAPLDETQIYPGPATIADWYWPLLLIAMLYQFCDVAKPTVHAICVVIDR